MRDLTRKELLQLATIDPMNGKAIATYQQMHAFQSGMEAIQYAPGHTVEELGELSESIRKLAQPEHTNTYALTCMLCGKSVTLTESEARVWRNSEEKLGVIAYCACGSIVKVSTKSRWPEDKAL